MRAATPDSGLPEPAPDREPDDRWRSELLEFIPEPYLVTDHQGGIQAANRPAAELFQCSSECLRGQSLSHFLLDREQDAFQRKLAEFTDGSRNAAGWRAHVHSAGNRPIPIAMAVRACRDANHPAILYWLLRDIADP